jgi:hypothetical protein
MTKKQLDEFFRQRLHPLESHVPDRLFESIMQRRRKRRMLVWWTYGTAAIILGLCLIMAGSYWSLIRPKTPNIIAQTQTTAVLPTVVADELASNKSIDIVKKEKTNNSNIINELKNTPSSVLITTLPTTALVNTQKVAPPKEELTQLENLNIRTSEETTTKSAVEKIAPPKEELAQLENLNIRTPEETTFKSSEKLNNETPNPLPIEEKTDANSANILYQLQGPECFVFGKHSQSRDFYVEALGALNYNNRTLSNRKDDFNNKYLEKRNTTETSMYGLGVGLRAVVLINQQLAVKAGLSYSEILERFEYIDQEYEIIIRDPLTGLVKSVEKGTSTQKSYNRYHSIDIPFMIGYELHNNKIGFGLDLGAAFNVGAWQKGDMFSAENKIVSFGKDPTTSKYPVVTPFQTIIGASVLADLSFFYQLDPKSQLFFQPHFKYYLNSFSNTTHPLDQRYWTVGLQVGLRKKF